MLSPSRRGALFGGVALAAALATSFASPAAGAAAEASKSAAKTALGATVTHTGKGPTGYQVTFRVSAPDATSMKIRGSWTFATADAISSDPANTNPIPATDWEPGDFPLQSPNQPSENWAVADMTKEQKTGVWTYTVPLPSGSFDYQYFADCTAAAPTLSGCTSMTDPAAPAWNVSGSKAVASQVFVPSDRRFGTADVSWMQDAPAGQRGKLTNVSYPSDLSTTPVGSHTMAVYLPAGYDAKRSTAYPLLVLSHGGGENELAWSTRGRMQQIVDNLVAEHKMQPAVIVMPNGSGLAAGTDSYVNELRNNLLPFVEKTYNVSSDAADRAFAGTSAYGGQANKFLFTDTAQFGYYGAWSPASQAPAITVTGTGAAPTADAYRTDALKQVLGIHIAIGQQDLGGNAPMLTAVTERAGLANAGVATTWFTENGGHTWAFWQDTLRDFLTRTAFRTTSTTVTTNGSTATATVEAATVEPAAPTGTVQFLVDGQKTGKPVALKNGKATLKGVASGTVTAVYSGDSLYNGGTAS